MGHRFKNYLLAATVLISLLAIFWSLFFFQNPKKVETDLGVTPTTSPPTQPPSPTSGGNLMTVVYSPTMDDIRNPERGFYSQADIFVDQPFTSSEISTRVPTDSLVWVYFHLENYRDPRDGPGVNLSNYQGKPLEPVDSGKGLDTVHKTFADARNKGLKLIIRFLYVGYPGIGSNTNSSTSQPDAPFSLIQQHINQLSPLLHQNKDVIAAFQFGFIGYWGEWHSSKYHTDNASRKAVIDAFLAATPSDRVIQIRYPRYKQALYGGPLTEAQAYNESNLARIGFHNDAFLRDENDGGTFRSNAGTVKVSNYCDESHLGENSCWRDYMQKDSKYVLVSGEAGTHSSTPSQYALCPNALTQLANFHFNSIHNGYSQVTLGAWTDGGCMPEIRRRLGYRYELREAFFPTSLNRGGILQVRIVLRNVGFGAMYNPRPVIAVLQGPGGRYDLPLNNVDPRKWYPGMESIIDSNINLPLSITPGIYRLSLWLPDESMNLRSNPQYSVRFANANIWEASTGINILTNNLVIQ